MKKVTDLKENEVVHCPTEREAEAICLLMHNAGFNWSSGKSFLEDTYWGKFKENTCYSPTTRLYNNLKDYKVNNFFTIHPASDFLPEHFYLGLPLYFVVKRDDSEEWEKYIDWLNEKFKQSWRGKNHLYYGFENGSVNNGTNCYTYTKSFKNTPTIFNSPKEFMNIVNKNKMNTNNRFPFQLKPSDAQRIIDVACSTWKDKLALWWGTNIVLGKSTEVLEAEYKEMRSACTADQHKLFDEIFGKDVEDKNAFVKEFDISFLNEMSKELFGDATVLTIGVLAAKNIERKDLKGKSIFVDNNHQVITHTASNGGTIIEIVKK
jgi:hypothetical protein